MSYRIGIDLGGTTIKTGVVNENMQIIGRATQKTSPSRMLDDIMEDIAQTVKTTLEDAKITMADVESIGMGTPGYIDKDNGLVIYSGNFNWKNIPVAEELEQWLDFPVKIENDANCAALGEVLAGAAKNAKCAVLLTLGTGVGGGVVINGSIMSGHIGPGTEMGHTRLILNGEPCSCGEKGCLEAYASGAALLRQRHRAEINHPDTMMKNYSPEDGSAVFECARAGDATAIEVRDRYVEYLGAGCVNIINIFAPDILIIGGGVSNAKDDLLKPLQEYVNIHRFGGRLSPTCEIKTALLGTDAGIIGAAYL